jgi:hypothetical protein
VAVLAERRILVGVHGSLGSLQALRYATAEARQCQIRLVPVIAWVPPGGDLAERRQPVYSLRQLWRQAAQDRLFDSFDRALGGVPDGLEVEPVVIRGPAGPVLTDAAGPAFGQPVLPGPRALPGDRGTTLGPAGRGQPGPAPVAAQGRRARARPPRRLAPPHFVRLNSYPVLRRPGRSGRGFFMPSGGAHGFR